MNISNLEFSVDEKWQKFEKECNSWASCILETAKDSNGVEYHRKKGSNIIYKKINDNKFECIECNSTILTTTVAHPIWDGPFPLSGSGECHYEHVPYCPKCEKKPNFDGTPISC